MRDALGELEQPSDGYTAGWAWSYALKAALEEWLDGDYDKDRAGLLEAVQSLETIDYEGMLPEEAGNRSGEPGENIFRQSVISKVDPAAPTGVSIVQDFFVGPTAEELRVRRAPASRADRDGARRPCPARAGWRRAPRPRPRAPGPAGPAARAGAGSPRRRSRRPRPAR